MRKLIAIFFLLTSFASYCLAQDTVTLTMYYAANGKKTADGTVITNPTKQRICAVSRDLLKKYPIGTKIHVEGYGVYTVHDKMGSRHRMMIDLLIPREQKAISKRGVKITKK